MHKIVTITLNPSIDKSTRVKAIMPEKKLRCEPPKFEPGGGGVNVSRAIKKLGGHSSAIYFAGGYSGEFFRSLLDLENISSIVVPIQEYTRENMIVVDESNNFQYRFGMPGPHVSEHEIERFFDLFNEIEGAEYVIASGSLPMGIKDSFFGRLAHLCHNKHAKLIVDTSGEPLRKAINEGVYMIKPNLGELSMLNGVDGLNDNDIVDAARNIIKRNGAEVIVVSMGPAGAVLVTANEVINSIAPTVHKKSTVGAGDTMLAGIVLALSQGLNWKEILHYGIAAGTATTMNEGTELCKKDDVERLFAYLKKYG